MTSQLFKESYIRKNWNTQSDKQMSVALSTSEYTVQRIRLLIGIQRQRSKNKKYDLETQIIPMLEDYMNNFLSVSDLASKHGITYATTNYYLSKLFTKKLTDDTEIRVFKSKM